MAAGKAAVLSIVITGDSKDAQIALQQVDGSVQKAEASTKKAGKSMTGVWAAVATSIGLCVRASGQLEAATSGLNTIFGEQADEMLKWAEGMAGMGLSTAQAAAGATILGAQLKTTGATEAQMARITTYLVETAANLANVLGGTASDAVLAMGAAMRGEYDSLERYGITLTADAVATEVARLASEGFITTSERQAKIVATLSLIYQQATEVLAGNTEGTVNQKTATDHLKASTKNLAAEIGDALTPANGLLAEAMADTIDKYLEQREESELLRVSNDLLLQILEDLQAILQPLLSTALELVSTLMDQLADLIETYVMPILDRLADVLDTVAQALDTVVGWVQDAVTWFDNFTDSVHEAIDALTFWNDTYDPNAAPAAAGVGAGPAGHGGPAVGALASPVVNVTINAPGLVDPYAAARLLMRALRDYAHVQGREAGQELAGAW